MATTRTLNQLLDIFENVTTRHMQVKTFYKGENSDFEASTKSKYPALLVNPTGASSPNNANGFSTFTVDFEVQILDLTHKHDSNDFDVLSDGLEILKDIVIEFTQHPTYVESDFSIDGGLSFTPIRNEYDSEASGWSVTISLLTPNRTSYCGTPIIGA